MRKRVANSPRLRFVIRHSSFASSPSPHQNASPCPSRFFQFGYRKAIAPADHSEFLSVRPAKPIREEYACPPCYISQTYWWHYKDTFLTLKCINLSDAHPLLPPPSYSD